MWHSELQDTRGIITAVWLTQGHQYFASLRFFLRYYKNNLQILILQTKNDCLIVLQFWVTYEPHVNFINQIYTLILYQNILYLHNFFRYI